MTIRPDDALTDRARVIIYLPRISRASGTSGTIDFSTTGGDSDDWLIFAHEATWDESTNKLTFELRDGYTLAANKQVTLQTVAGEFVLPDEMDANWNQLTVQARSTDEVDELIRATPVMQSSRVPHVRFFTLSQIQYSEDSPTPGSFTDVTLTFQTNRPMFVGTKMYLRLTGFQAEVIEVPISGDHVANFKDGIATFSLTENILELEVISTLYSNEDVMTITFLGLIVPPALYENDESLLIWNSDYGAAQQPVQSSPEIGDGYKTFVQSQVSYSPETSSRAPRMEASSIALAFSVPAFLIPSIRRVLAVVWICLTLVLTKPVSGAPTSPSTLSTASSPVSTTFSATWATV
jgi:hypothetical protein